MSLDNLQILSVLPVLGHPRDSKRITMLQQAGFMVEAVAFERDFHTGRLPDCPVERLGEISHRRYFQRILKLIIALPAVRRAIRRNHLVYASGPDMAYLALIAGLGLGKPVILEVGDIRELQVASGLKGWLVRAVDKCFINACRLLVVTAPGFLEVYYRQWLKTKIPALVIENKLETSFVNNENPKELFRSIQGKPLVERPLRIGYFGLLRDEWSWQVLETLASARPQDIEIVVAGLPMNPIDLPQRAEKYTNIEFRGEYRSPQDLPSLYNSVDMVWACYPYIGTHDWNLRWARPNRFYESCFFQKPAFTRAGCQDAVDVEHYKIGMIIHDHNVKKVVDTICKIELNDLAVWQENMSKLPRKVYMYTTEIAELKNALVSIAKDNLGHIKK